MFNKHGFIFKVHIDSNAVIAGSECFIVDNYANKSFIELIDFKLIDPLKASSLTVIEIIAVILI